MRLIKLVREEEEEDEEEEEEEEEALHDIFLYLPCLVIIFVICLIICGKSSPRFCALTLCVPCVILSVCYFCFSRSPIALHDFGVW